VSLAFLDLPDRVRYTVAYTSIASVTELEKEKEGPDGSKRQGGLNTIIFGWLGRASFETL
jgi:hypothetical protein